MLGLQYRIGSNGTWYGSVHNGQEDSTDVLTGSSYQTQQDYDYPTLTEGNNMIYFRAIDAAGNISDSITSAVIKINTSSPSSPQNVTASPEENTTNLFAFSWAAPTTYIGQASSVSYCYTVNTLPTNNTCTYTAPGQTSLSPSAYATQPGDNTFYVVARDEAGNINYATAASTTFKANTDAPGIPLNMDIADVSVKDTQSWKLAISWEPPTDIGAGIANYRVLRSSTSSTTGFVQVATTQGNSFVDTQLNAVTYYYKVRACDSANNCGADSAVVSKLPTGKYTTPAEINGSPVIMVSNRKATITWYTDRNSDSRIQYGVESGNYQPTEAAISEQTKTHSVELTNLRAGTTYFYRAKWTDEDGNTGTTSELSFTTLPAPLIKDVEVVKKNLTTATIQFTSTGATGIRLYYGKSDSFGGIKILNTSTSASTYAIELSGLEDGTTYYYRVNPIDSDGNEYEQTVLGFTTPPRPRIYNLQFQPMANEPTNTQLITWQTNIPTSTQLTYGIEGTNGQDVIDTNLVTDHSMVIRNLKDNSSYFLLAQSRDMDGNIALSDRQTFMTALDTRPPKVSDVYVEASIKGIGNDAKGQIVVSWKTDEPTTSQVSYSLGGSNGSYTDSTVYDNRLKTEHTVILSNLRTSSVYYLKPVSNDGAGNRADTNEQSAIIGRPSDNVLTIIMNALYKTFGL